LVSSWFGGSYQAKALAGLPQPGEHHHRQLAQRPFQPRRDFAGKVVCHNTTLDSGIMTERQGDSGSSSFFLARCREAQGGRWRILSLVTSAATRRGLAVFRANPVLSDLRQRLLALRAMEISAHGMSFPS
jgi:hypothetical protein